jgi:dihydrofolate synthase / folylpolyglutamate synthase
MVLENYLNSKPLYYDKIDFNNIKIAWKYLSTYINLPFVIHIVGTNGKGSTSRYLASYLFQSKFKVLHYSSPHIISFNERIWIDGKDSTSNQLDDAHLKLQKILPKELSSRLTYFEYTTLIALLLSDKLDYLVLEAGLGGEFDATNVVKNDLTLITTIGLDHTEFLGNTIKEIASTKMRSCDNKYILGYQVSKVEVNNAKEEALYNKKEIPFNTNIKLPKEIESLPIYLKNNLKLALTAIEYLDIKNDNFKIPQLFGRCQRYKKNITIDVGHNSLAASVLLREFLGKKIKLIYSSYKDKDYGSILMILKPIIDEVLIIDIDDSRMAKKYDLINICNKLSLKYNNFNTTEENKEYLVFGSFKVVEEFLKRDN